MKPKFVILENSVYEEMRDSIRLYEHLNNKEGVIVKPTEVITAFGEVDRIMIFSENETIINLAKDLEKVSDENRQVYIKYMNMLKKTKSLRWWHFRKIKELRKSA
jgi:hypothetical protein